MVGPLEHREARAEIARELLGLGDVAELVVAADEDCEAPLERGAVLLHEVEDADGRRDEGDALDAPFDDRGAQADERAERVAADCDLRARRAGAEIAERGARVLDLAHAFGVSPAALAHAAVVEAEGRDVVPALLGEHLRDRERHRAVHRAAVERMRVAKNDGSFRRG